MNALKVKKALAQARIVLIGNPSSWYLRWYSFPDLEVIRRKVGTIFTPIELRELIEQVEVGDLGKAETLAEEWANGAEKVMEPLPYTLRDCHGNGGVTAFTEVPLGTEVTLARAQRNLESITAVRGEITACDDTVFCRNTLTIKVDNAREFVRRAEGNHHALVFGDYLENLKVLGELIGCEVHVV